MEKLPLTIFMGIIIVGLCVWVFTGDNGVNKTIGDGYDNLKTEVRSYGYKPGP